MESKALKRLERLRELNSDRNWVNEDLYRLMYQKDLYIIAYGAIKSEPGNMTPGTDGETLDGFSLERIDKIIGQIKDESFAFKPVRRVYIPKESDPKKERPLGVPGPNDKIVQEVIRMILEAIYDSPKGSFFLATSHGFRTGKGCHSALKDIRTGWSGTTWFVEGDIKGCFDNIDHHTLIDLLRRKIRDERFINLIWKLIRAGYVWLEERQDSLVGTPQGTIVSPILANIYLHELDVHVENLRQKYDAGTKRKLSKEYRKRQYHRDRLRERLANGEDVLKEYREATKLLMKTPSVDTQDPGFIRVKYVRYADDWIVGINGPKSLANSLKEEIKTFLQDTLKLTLSEEKTKITHASSEKASFLGTLISCGTDGDDEKQAKISDSRGRKFKRRVTGSQITLQAPVGKLVKRLEKKGHCDGMGFPKAKAMWNLLDADQIVARMGSMNRGMLAYYRFADNYSALSRIQYILQYSCGKTLARKFQRSLKSIFRKYGEPIMVKLESKRGEIRRVTFHTEKDWSKKRISGFAMGNEKIDLVRTAWSLRTKSKLGHPCAICGNTKDLEMHHVRAIRKMDAKKPTGFTRLMANLNRKQIPVCHECHMKIHEGKHDSLKLADLAYDPRR